MRRLLLIPLLLSCSETPVALPRLLPHAVVTAAPPVADSGVCEIYALDAGAADIERGVLTAFEGYSDSLYQPSDRSGPTIGFGLDLAHASPASIRYVLQGTMPKEQLFVMLSAQGLTGRKAREWVRANKGLRLNPCARALIESRQYAHYWNSVRRGRPYLDRAPREVKTVITSFVMHTGRVDPLLPALQRQDWKQLSDIVRGHAWAGPESTWFRDRRSQEADLIDAGHRSAGVDYD